MPIINFCKNFVDAGGVTKPLRPKALAILAGQTLPALQSVSILGFKFVICPYLLGDITFYSHRFLTIPNNRILTKFTLFFQRFTYSLLERIKHSPTIFRWLSFM